MAEDVPQEFYDAVDQFIHVANELSGKEGVSRISAVIMYAAARYNAHCMFTMDPEAAKNLNAAIDYFSSQYRSMLKENAERLTQAKTRPPGVA